MGNFTHSFETCSLSYAFSAISGKWKPYILWYLHGSPDGTCRYGRLKRKVPYNISHKIFTQQLQELERDNIIIRREYDEKPLRVEYSLTEYGKLLIPLLLYLRDWGALAFSNFTEQDLLDRTRGNIDGDTINYSYHSEALGKYVKIELKY